MIDCWSKALAMSGNSNLQLQQQPLAPVQLFLASETMNQVLVQLVQAIRDAVQKVLLVLPSFKSPNISLIKEKCGDTSRIIFYTNLAKVGL